MKRKTKLVLFYASLLLMSLVFTLQWQSGDLEGGTFSGDSTLSDKNYNYDIPSNVSYIHHIKVNVSVSALANNRGAAITLEVWTNDGTNDLHQIGATVTPAGVGTYDFESSNSQVVGDLIPGATNYVHVIANNVDPGGGCAAQDAIEWDYVMVTLNHTLPPDVESPRTYLSGTLQKTSVYYVGGEVRIRVNVSDNEGAGDIDTVILTIKNPQDTVKVNNASMSNVGLIANGFIYEYNYTLPIEANAAGDWRIKVYANDSRGLIGSNTSSFKVKPVVKADNSSYLVDETVTITGYGWAGASDVTLSLREPDNDIISGYPLNVSSDASGNISSSWAVPVNAEGGSYTLHALDPSDSGINDTTYFNVTALTLTTNSINYVINDSVNMAGAGFKPNTNVTIYIINSTGGFVAGYPINVSSNSTGGFINSWNITPGEALGSYTVNATETVNKNRSKITSFEIVSAIIQTDKTLYQWGETVNITGYSWNSNVDVTLNITDPNGVTVYGPKNLTSNASGWINDTWIVYQGAAFGNYTLSGFEPAAPSKNDKATFTVHDPIAPNITDVSPINLSYGLGEIILFTANVTDNTEVDTVYADITLPGGGNTQCYMVNNSPDIFTCSFQPHMAGTYYYEIIAKDSSGNTQNYHPYVYVNGNGSMQVYTIKGTYGLQENVTLLNPSAWTSGDQENSSQNTITNITLVDADFESSTEGFIYQDDLYQGTALPDETDGNREASGYCSSGSCIHVDMNTNPDSSGPWSGGWNRSFNVSGSPDLVRISFDYTLAITTTTEWAECARLYYRNLNNGADIQGDEICGQGGNPGGYETTSGSINYELQLSDGTYYFDVGGWFSDVSAANEQADVWIDNIIIELINTTPDGEASTDWVSYDDINGSTLDLLDLIEILVEVESFNASGSVNASNNYPDLEVAVWNGSSYVGGYYCNVYEYYGDVGSVLWNCSILVSDSSIVEAWQNPANRLVQVRAVYLDSENGLNDWINWTGLYAKLISGSLAYNTGSTNISGYLLMTVEQNDSGSWVHIATVINDTNTSTLRNISKGSYLDTAAIWNAKPWNTNSYSSGVYRVYSALVNNEGSVLQGDDGNPIKAYDNFNISIYGSINATPGTVGYGQTVLISAEVFDTSTDEVWVYIARPGEGYSSYQMTNVSDTIYHFNYTNTWIWGDYNYYIWSNNTAGFNSSTSTYQFYVRANTTLTVKTVNDSYGPQSDVNLQANETNWWDDSYRYRKQLTITNVNDTLSMEAGYSVKLTLDTAAFVNEGKMQSDGDDLRVVWYNNSSSTWVEVDRINETAFNTASTIIWFPTQVNISANGVDTNYYLYYGNPSAANPPDNRSKVYVWWDDFSTNTLSKYNLSKWVDIHGNAGQYQAPTYDAVNDRVTYDTGDNHQADMYPTGVTVKDFILEVDYYITGSYPTNATMALIGRMENPGQASTHYYIDYSAQSGYESPGISMDTWTNGERNHDIYDEETDYYFEWFEIQNIKYSIYSDIHRVWINSDITQPADIYVTNNTHTSAGVFGISAAQAIGWFDNFKVRKFIGQDPTVSLGSEDDRIESRASNHGTTNISGYLEMRVQRYSSGSWVNFEPPFINDRMPPPTLRDINAGGILMLDGLWNPAGWDTDLNTPGLYRAFVRLTDQSGNTLKNDDSSLIRGWYNFTIISSELRLTQLKHENNHTIGLNEYETGDNIAWINITVTNYNATSINASTTLNVLDSSTNTVSWGPQSETKYCGNLSVNQSCERRFDNNTFGYQVPLDATSGGYSFFWNVTMNSDTGSTTHNSSLSFMLHHIPDNLSSSIDPDKIFQNQSAIYNLTLTNPWSSNLTNITVSLNLPNIPGINVSCLATGLPYCNLSNLGPGVSITFSFNITTNKTPSGDYYVNATLNYTNPGLEFHSWADQQNQLLRIRIPGQFVEIFTWPANITRGGYGNITGYSNNTLGSSMHNVTLNWTLPYGWSNSSGSLSQFDDDQNAGEMMWNNVTVYVNLSSGLGPRTIELRSLSAEGYEDWDTESITVYAKTYISNLQSNETDPIKNNTIRISGRLLLDNDTPIFGRTVSLFDETDNVAAGSDVTDATGWFYITYLIPDNASIGVHTFNASFSGLLASYYLASFNETNVTVHDKPLILDVVDYPDPVGYGYNVTIEANVTDLEGVDTVRVCVSPPALPMSCHTMNNYSADIYEFNYSNTWVMGDYAYYVWANDTAGKQAFSSTYFFHVGANMVLNIKTINDSYGPNEDVDITNTSMWWNYSWSYRRQLNITENNNSRLTDYVVEIKFDTKSLISAGKMQSDCDDIRVASNNTLLNYTVRNNTCNTNETVIQFEVDIDSGGSLDDVYLYYDNPNATNKRTEVGYHPDANTILLYHFTEGSGTNVIDYSGNGNNGTLVRGPIWVTSPVKYGEYAINLPGTNEYIEEGTAMSVQSEGTLELWFRLDDEFNSSASNSMGIFGLWSAGNSNMDVSLCGQDRNDANCNDGGLMFKTEAPGTGTDYCTSNRVLWEAGQWYHLAVTWDGATRKIYVNGELDNSCADNGAMNFAGADLFIGAAQIDQIDNDPIMYLDGVVDEVRASNVSRSATELLSRVNEPNITLIGLEQNYSSQSLVYNKLDTNVMGYLLMKVQHYEGGGWVDVEKGNPVVNDSTPRTINSYSHLSLNSLWNPAGWDTDKQTPGLYRAYAAFTDTNGNILKNDDSSLIYDTYEFNITQPKSIIQLEEIRIYDVSNAANKKSDTSYLMGSGLNTSFTLFTNKTYRVEIRVFNNETSEESWELSSSDDIFHEYLNETWYVNETDWIWYSNVSHNLTGGRWINGAINWNTSLNGSLQVNSSMTFYYIFNLNTSNAESYQVHFMLNDSNFILQDYSLYDIVISENKSPGLYNNTYNLSPSIVHRNETLHVYARWDEVISQAIAEYNSTSSSLVNHSISLPEPNPQNWTNHTVSLNSSWILGGHKAKIYASDLNGNWNKTLPYLDYAVWGWSYANNSMLKNDTIAIGSQATIYCRVTSDNGSALSGYNVTFYNSTHLLGVNQTNASGWASFTFIDSSLGYENLTCVIDDYGAIYHNSSSQYYRIETLRTIEVRAPWYVNVTQNTSKVHRGENLLFSAYWYDDVWLDYAWLESNETGAWLNNSLASRVSMNDVETFSLFYVTIPNNSILGPMAWRIYANDTSSNINVTDPINYTVVWGYSIINTSSLSPNPIYVNNTTTMSCQVLDYHSGQPISNYNVSFYSNESGYMGVNQTNATGWATLTFIDNTSGWETITCNITSDPAKYYDPGTPNSSSKNLRAALPGEDVTPPGAVIYGLNASWIWKGQSVYAYAQWNENITESNITYNTTSSTLDVFPTDTVIGNQTNHTLQSNSSWIVGIHYVKINASDYWGNWNNTLPYLNFTVWGRSKVGWHSPNTTVYRGNISLRCRVYDKDGGYGIPDYPVDFYNGSWDYLDTVNTNGSGIATYNWSALNEKVGSKTFHCMINDNGYYNTTNADDDDAGSFNLIGRLNASIDYPLIGLNVHRGESIDLNSTTRDENGLIISPVTAAWYNQSWANIANGEDSSWIIPPTYNIGTETLYLNVSKQYYDNDTSNVTIYVWGYANVSFASPPNGSNVSQGSTTNLVCRVTDNKTGEGIHNYPVRFYYRNTTEAGYHYIGTDDTNATGYALYGWNTGGLPLDNYTIKCNISDNTTLYYNKSTPYEANITVKLIVSGGVLEVELLLPPYIPGLGNASNGAGYKIGQGRVFVVSANVTCRNTNCGDVMGTIRYNASGGTPNTAINTTSDTPFYITDAPSLNPKSCAANPLDVNESCIINWSLNATGAILSKWRIDVLFDATAAPSNNTNYTNIEITKVLIMILSNDTIDFGTLVPGDSCNASQTNPIIITLHNNSNNADGIYLKGTNLTNGPSQIGVRNVSWALVNNCPLAGNLTGSWQLIQANVASGTNINTYYFIDIPPTPALTYTGTAYIMANASVP